MNATTNTNISPKRTISTTLASVATALLLATGCGGEQAKAPTPSPAPPATYTTTTTPETADTTPATTATPSTNSTPTDDTPTDKQPTTITLIAYDSFPDSEATGEDRNPIWVAIDEFTAETGITVKLLRGGDTGTMVAKAGLTAGNPEGDVIWGVDNTFLSRAIEEGIFAPYTANGINSLSPAARTLVPNGEATPVDFGDVCVNYHIANLDAKGLKPPTSLADLAKPEYASQLVVQNPATSSPGLAFMLATIAEFGEDGWQDYWTKLHSNGVAVVDGWSEAYYEQFSSNGGDRDLVVSYGSSPPFEVLYADEPTDTARTGVVESTCFRQTEFAGVLAGSKAPEAAQKFVDFLISERFQREIPLNLYVFPTNTSVTLDSVFTAHAVIPDTPLSVDPAQIETKRATWLDTWAELRSAN